MKRLSHLHMFTVALAVAGSAVAEESARPRFDETGAVHVPPFVLPPSEFMSPEAQAFMRHRAGRPLELPTREPDIAKSRKALAAMLAPQVEGVLKMNPVEVVEDEVGGVPVRIVTPKNAEPDPDRVLINLHGGAFNTCWESCSLLESAPLAAQGGYRVVSINYRMAPEARHPAAVEDVATVYRELLKEHGPQQIGIYGCSAGGALSAQAAAWFPANDLPQPAAIGIFGAGGVRFTTGDSAYVAAYIDGSFPPPPAPGEQAMDMTRGYFEGSDMSDPIISPALHLDVLKQFPPTMIVTGTRAMDLSPAIYTNAQLIKAGKRPLLLVGEGMSHCYIYMAHLPEARDAYRAILDFFDEHLE